MKQTKKLTLSAMIVALGTVFMVLGAVIEVFDLTAVALASVLVAFVYIELGSPYTWLVWICTTLCTFLLYQHSAMWFIYLVLFGIYPILKGYIERLKRPLWWPLKLVYGNIAFVLMLFGIKLITGLPFIDPTEDFLGISGKALYIVTWVLLNVALIAYDFFITVMVRFYMERLRPKFRKILK
ncbi:MAG: hypothetical protein IJW53_06275 [Clostridia bacterium]|nr:hypothetical protein [Clostridia bacterium]